MLIHVCAVQVAQTTFQSDLSVDHSKDCIEAVDHIPVHIGAIELKKQLYNAVIPKWHEWTNNYPLSPEDVTMRNNNWVRLVPRNPDRDVISDQFFKRGKKGAVVFKGGKCIINLHVPNHIYSVVVARKEADESDINEFEESEGKAAVINHAVADFMVCLLIEKKKDRRTKHVSGSQNGSDEKQALTNPLAESLRHQISYPF